MIGTDSSDFQVADWTVRPRAGELVRGDTVVKLEPKVMDVLVMLARQPGEVVSRQELEDTVWRGTVVSYDALIKAIAKLREAFGDTGRPATVIQTVSKKGYRLAAPVRHRAIAVSTTPPAPAPPSRRRAVPRPAMALLVASAVLAGLILSMLFLPREMQATRDAAGLSDGKPGLLVLPFKNLRADRSNENLADGLTSDIITDLSKLDTLWVIAATSVQQFKGVATGAQRAVEAFKVRYVVDGDLLRTGERLRINVRLLDAGQGKVLWATRYDRRAADLFSIQNEMVNNIVYSLSLKLSDVELKRIAKPYTGNLDAYEAFVQARSLYYPHVYEDNLKARDAYRRAIDLDPGFARAHAGLALTYAAVYRHQWPSEVEDPLARALEIAKLAQRLDPDLPEVYWVLGLIHVYRKNTETAIDHLNRAIAINPNYADAYALLGVAYVWEDKIDIAIRNLKRSLRLDPAGSFLHYRMLGIAHYYLDDYDQALVYLLQSYERNPTHLDTVLFLACTYLHLDQTDQALWMMEQANTIQPGLVPEQALEAVPFQDRDKRERILGDLTRLMAIQASAR